MRDRDRQREETAMQIFCPAIIIFSLEPLPQNNDPKYAAVTGGLSREEIGFGWSIRGFIFHQYFIKKKKRNESSHLRKHSHIHSFILTQPVSLPALTLEWVYLWFLSFSVSLFGCSFMPNLNVSPSGCWTEAHANRICLCSFTWNKIINEYFMVKKLIRIMIFLIDRNRKHLQKLCFISDRSVWATVFGHCYGRMVQSDFSKLKLCHAD